MNTIDKHFESLYPSDSRFSEVEKIITYIKSGNCAQVISLPGVGRSNVLRLLAYNHKARALHLGENQKWFHFVLMNFSEIKTRPLKDVNKFMFLELAESLLERKMEEEHKKVKEYLRESVKTDDELLIFQGLKKSIDYLCLEKEMTIVFLFDRFEEYTNIVESTFFDNLRVLRDRAKYRFSAVFPLNRPLEETLEPQIISSFYEFLVGNHVYLSLGDEKIREFRLSYLKKTTEKLIDKKALEQIDSLTGGLGKLWLVSIETCLSNRGGMKQLGNLADFLLDNSKVKAVLLEILRSLSPYEQSLIIKDQAHESSHLIAVGLIKNNKFSVPLLERFVKAEAKNLNESIIYDEKTNEIRKGEVNISEGLTSSEFKAFRFLVQNKDRIIGRDEIVNAVWSDLSSTAGVTEQALDQLIFRLRKKIEENPNSPKHITTIKGRGFKFVS